MATTKLPASYASLPFNTIRLSHVPASSPEPTPVILLTLYRPGKNNAFTGEMRQELEDIYTLFNVDNRIKCIVLTGYGKMFCAGADLDIGFRRSAEATKSAETTKNHRDGGGRVALAIHRCSKPTIGAINGSAVGVGITMTLPMSIRIVSSTAKIGFVFARRGIIMEACSSFFLPRLIGYSRAVHLVTTGAVYPATSNLFDGLFSECLPSEKVLPRALEIAQEVARNTSTLTNKLMRDLIWRAPGSAEETHLLDSQIIYDLFGSKDNDEGVKAFMEKRLVNFTATIDKDAPSAYPWWTPVDTVSPDEEPTAKPKL